MQLRYLKSNKYVTVYYYFVQISLKNGLYKIINTIVLYDCTKQLTLSLQCVGTKPWGHATKTRNSNNFAQLTSLVSCIAARNVYNYFRVYRVLCPNTFFDNFLFNGFCVQKRFQILSRYVRFFFTFSLSALCIILTVTKNNVILI